MHLLPLKDSLRLQSTQRFKSTVLKLVSPSTACAAEDVGLGVFGLDDDGWKDRVRLDSTGRYEMD
jgi:hypothetical protein